MPQKDKEIRRKYNAEYFRRWRRGNPEKYAELRRKNHIRAKERLREYKQKLVAMKGGKCEFCGYNKCLGAIEFAHKNKKDKEFEVSRPKWGWEKMLKEAEKCLLLCANCHREYDNGLLVQK